MTKRTTSTATKATKSEPYLTVEQAEEQTGIPAWRIKRWVSADRLPGYRPDASKDGKHGRLYVRASDIHALMESAEH